MVFGQTTPPQWIIDLPAGRYTVKQLKEKTGLTPGGIRYTLKRYGAIIEKEVVLNYLMRNIYVWTGYKRENIS